MQADMPPFCLPHAKVYTFSTTLELSGEHHVSHCLRLSLIFLLRVQRLKQSYDVQEEGCCLLLLPFTFFPCCSVRDFLPQSASLHRSKLKILQGSQNLLQDLYGEKQGGLCPPVEIVPTAEFLCYRDKRYTGCLLALCGTNLCGARYRRKHRHSLLGL